MPSASKPPEPLLHFETRAAFRAWLEAHHGDHPPVWLRFYKKHTGRAQCTYDEAVEEALCFGWIDSLVRRLDEDCYAQLFSPRRDVTSWSATNLARARRLIAEGRMTPAGRARLGVDPEAALAAKADAAEPALDGELEAALRADRGAFRAFEGLPPSHRRQYVRWILQAKRPETRRRRLEEAKRLLAAGKPLGMK